MRDKRHNGAQKRPAEIRASQGTSGVLAIGFGKVDQISQEQERRSPAKEDRRERRSYLTDTAG